MAPQCGPAGLGCTTPETSYEHILVRVCATPQLGGRPLRSPLQPPLSYLIPELSFRARRYTIKAKTADPAADPKGDAAAASAAPAAPAAAAAGEEVTEVTPPGNSTTWEIQTGYPGRLPLPRLPFVRSKVFAFSWVPKNGRAGPGWRQHGRRPGAFRAPGVASPPARPEPAPSGDLWGEGVPPRSNHFA